MTKVMRTSRQGLTRCPSCLTHVEVGPALSEAVCGFCGANLVAARRADGGVLGSAALARLGASSSGKLAAALGVSLAMSACDGPDVDDKPAEKRELSASTAAPVYGGPPQRVIPELAKEPEPVAPVPATEPVQPAIYGGPAMGGVPSGVDTGTPQGAPKDKAGPVPVGPVPARDEPARPIYGGPPIGPAGPPKPEEVRTAPASQPPTGEVYGGPPQGLSREEEELVPVKPVPAEETPPQKIYGGPPVDRAPVYPDEPSK